MKAGLFLQAYPRTIEPRHLAAIDGDAELVKSRQWSNRFGEILYDTLEGNPPSDEQFVDTIGSYKGWLAHGLPHLAGSLVRREDRDAFEHLNEINFHYLNSGMGGMWLLLINAQRNNHHTTDRQKYIEMAQDALALNGLEYYFSREAVSGQEANYIYFDHDNKRRREHFEGRAHEFDAAVVLLQAMRQRKELIVVPAPLQFEKFNQRSATTGGKSARSDFIFVKGDEVGGVQVKGFVTAEAKSEYDASRVVMLDAANDLGNQRYLRTKQKCSDKRLVSWGGLICAQRVAGIKLHKGALSNQLARRELIATMGRAKFLTAGVESYLKLATSRITERIDDYVEQSTLPEEVELTS
ncbi:hypothetical protein BH09PAT4_BH09PAT4_04530 [soil metagenome]